MSCYLSAACVCNSDEFLLHVCCFLLGFGAVFLEGAMAPGEILDDKLSAYAKDKNFEVFMEGLKPNEAQLLWKRFEGERKSDDSVTQHWMESTSGQGGLAKKRKLLKVFVDSNCKTSDTYIELAVTISKTKS